MAGEVEPEPSPEDFALVRRDDDYDAAPPPGKLVPATEADKKGSILVDAHTLELATKIAKAREAKEKKYAPDPHRLLPQSPDAEKGLLASMMLSPREVCAECQKRRIDETFLAIPAHAIIYTKTMLMFDRTEPIDFITLTQFLRDERVLDQCGGAAFITDLFTYLPTAANAEYYIEILEEKRALREAIKVGTQYVGRCYDEQGVAWELIDGFERDLLKVRDATINTTLSTPQELVVEAIGAIENLYERRGSITGITTGFPELDKMIDGLHPDEMTVIAARPSMGKTSYAMNIAEHLAIDLKMPIAVFSLEMSKQQLMQRLLCSRARVNLARVRDGFLSERDFPALQMAASKIADSQLWIDDASDLTIQELRGRARRMKQQHKIGAVFVDYLQLLKSATKRAQENRQQEVTEVSSGLKALAKELHVPVVVLAQLSRYDKNAPAGKIPRPRLHDLRESGSIEQDADNVMFLVRDEFYAEDEEARAAMAGKATLHIEKQRNGPVGDVYLTFLKEFTRFETRAYEVEEDTQQQFPV